MLLVFDLSCMVSADFLYCETQYLDMSVPRACVGCRFQNPAKGEPGLIPSLDAIATTIVGSR